MAHVEIVVLARLLTAVLGKEITRFVYSLKA